MNVESSKFKVEMLSFNSINLGLGATHCSASAQNLRPSTINIRTSKGIALVIVLWVIAILSMIVLEFSFAMRTEVNIAKNFKEEMQFYAMAEGGIQRAIAELIYKNDSRVQVLRKTLKTEEIPPEKREWVTDGRPYRLTFDQGVCEVRIIGEGGKININTVSEATLRKIIEKLGVDVEKRDIVADSIMDWKDADDFYRINGAENDYYRSLKEPYQCKNADFDSIEELLLVRGITRDLFYGKKELKEAETGLKVESVGLRDIFSIYSPSQQIDINSATLPVLRGVLGIPNEIARQIVKAREEKGFLYQQDLLQRVPTLAPFAGELENLVTYQSMTTYYTIESRGKNHEGRSVRGLKAIVKIGRNEKEGYRVIQWLDALF